jgi:hypothetical protein
LELVLTIFVAAKTAFPLEAIMDFLDLAIGDKLVPAAIRLRALRASPVPPPPPPLRMVDRALW